MSDPILSSHPNSERVYSPDHADDGTVGSEGGARSGGRRSYIASDEPRTVFMSQPVFSLSRLAHWMRGRRHS